MSRPPFTGNSSVALGALYGWLAVALGAFGAHAIKDNLTAAQLEIYHTASLYLMFHALALVGLGVWCNQQGQRPGLAGWAWGAGIALFSGSLYALALTGVKALGAITPVGGLLLMAGWIALALRAWKA